MKIAKNKNIVILGPTASGKTNLAVKMAYDFDGEVISADSRQVYKGMDIGTGKDLDEYFLKIKDKKPKTKNSFRTVKIPYHLIDVLSPNTSFDLAKFVKKARIAMVDIHGRDKLPIIAGGTGLYTQALVDGYNLSTKGADSDFRKQLEEMSVLQVYAKLKKLNKKMAENLNASEQKNKRRLIRYVEIEKGRLDKNYENKKDISQRKNFLIIGIACPREQLYERINKRLIARLENEGMIEEVARLHKTDKVSWQRLSSFGLEYKYLTLYLRGKLNYEKMVAELDQASRHFAKRQLSWYRRWEREGARINWVNSYAEAKKLVISYLKVKKA